MLPFLIGNYSSRSMLKFVLFTNIHNVVKGHVTFLASSPAYLQIHPFSSSSSLKSADLSLGNQNTFTVNYLINSCGLTPERAVLASKHLKLRAAEKPDAVLAFFKNHGFTQTQISKLIHTFPLLLGFNPEKSFFPKMKFFESKGISLPEIVALVSQSPKILAVSLENCLIPSFNFYSSFFKSKEKANVVFKQFLKYPLSHVEKYTESNMNMLKQGGVPIKNIAFFVAHHSSAIATNSEKFKRALGEVEIMDFDPQKVNFLTAVKIFLSLAKSTWDRKIKVYKQWGWSGDDVVSAFRKYPFCMGLSEEKMNSVMEHYINKMGLKSSFLAQRPTYLAYSLEKRIVPRSLVYQVLVSKGLLKPCDTSLMTLIHYSDERFTERITRLYGNEAPELLKLYTKTKLNLAEVKMDTS